MRRNTSENIAQQTKSTYKQYEKINSFVEVGYFLENYVVSGGEVTKNIKHNHKVDVSKVVIVLNDDTYVRDGVTFSTQIPNTTYYVDFVDGDFTWGTSHPTGTPKEDYFPIAEVTTDGNGNVISITDKRGEIGGFRTKWDSFRLLARVTEKMVKKEPVRIVCYGDSITYGYESGTGAQLPDNYPATLQGLLRDFYKNDKINVINRGYSGRRSDELVRPEYTDVVKDDNPDVIIFMCGINDCFGNSYGPVIPVERYFNNLVRLKEIFKDKPLIYMTPTPVWGGFTSAVSDEDKKTRIFEYVRAVFATGQKMNCPVVDLYSMIQKDFYYREKRPKDVEPDMVHFTNDYYKRIGEFVFTGAWVNIDISVSDETFFPAYHAMFRFGDVATSFYENQFNPMRYNILLRSDATKKCFSYVFVDCQRVDFYLNDIIWYAGSSQNIIRVDGVEYVNSSYSSIDIALWDVKKYIATLPYGLHKIEFEAVESEGRYFGINGITFQPVSSPLVDQAEPALKGTLVHEQKYKTLFEGKAEISTLRTSTGYNYSKLLTLGQERKKQYRLYTQMGSGSGLGFGSYDARGTDGKVYRSPYIIIFLSTFGIANLYTRRLSNLNEWLDDTFPLNSNNVPFTKALYIIDVIVHSDSVDFYMNEALVGSLANNQLPLGIHDFYLWSYSNGALDSDSVTKVFRIEEVPYGLPITTFREGDEYFDSVAQVKKIYDGTAWKTVTMG